MGDFQKPYGATVLVAFAEGILSDPDVDKDASRN